MSNVYSFNISLTPYQALSLIRDTLPRNSELVHEEINDAGDGRMIGTLVYERYFFRSANQAALVIIIDNLQGVTNVRLIAAGVSNGMILKIDWGAGASFVSSVEKLLEPYVIDEP
ncbi:DUF6054 family protein [Paenibacillus sp. sgz500958]|uniref:DUF6054 family protein n=1 Tax=Paenibacillus sp. sgz500958 TaxID=3242475 RepID=UPI0036D2E697